MDQQTAFHGSLSLLEARACLLVQIYGDDDRQAQVAMSSATEGEEGSPAPHARTHPSVLLGGSILSWARRWALN